MYQWKVEKGTQKVDLATANCEGIGDSATSPEDSIDIVSTGASQAGGDVEVSLSVEGVEQARIKTEVFAPGFSEWLRDEDSPTSPVDPLGYQSLIWYRTIDNMGRQLMKPCGHNELFTSEPTPDYEGEDWPLHGESGGGYVMNEDGEWYDNMMFMGLNRTPLPSPPPPPPSPVGNVKVDHWFGDWYAGSASKGKGIKVLSNIKWQRYQDHGRHE